MPLIVAQRVARRKSSFAAGGGFFPADLALRGDDSAVAVAQDARFGQGFEE